MSEYNPTIKQLEADLFGLEVRYTTSTSTATKGVRIYARTYPHKLKAFLENSMKAARLAEDIIQLCDRKIKYYGTRYVRAMEARRNYNRGRICEGMCRALMYKLTDVPIKRWIHSQNQ